MKGRKFLIFIVEVVWHSYLSLINKVFFKVYPYTLTYTCIFLFKQLQNKCILQMFITLFSENSTKYYSIPSAVCTCMWGPKGENTLWSCNILHQIEWHFPHFIHFTVIIAINIETPYLPVRCRSIPVTVMYGMWFCNLWKSFAIYLATSLVT